MFLIGSCYENCEFFDSVTRKFTSIKTLSKNLKGINLNPNQIVCVGYNIYFFRKEATNEFKVKSYDVKKNDFGFKNSLYLGNNNNFSCTKVPMS